jgi:protein SCO1/2
MGGRLFLSLLTAFWGAACRADTPPDLGTVPPFALTERGGRTVTEADLRGKVWVASFVFVRCTQGCTQVTATMARLQSELGLAKRDDVRLVTFTVDPERDGPEELSDYARHFQADPEKWLFLTGDKEKIHRLLIEGFKVGVQEKPPDQRKPGDEFTHSTKLVVVDRRGRIRGYFDGLPPGPEEEYRQHFEEDQRRLVETVNVLARGAIDFPLLNASLNALAGVLLVLGYVAVRTRRIALHKATMLTALIVSAVFLGCYLYYHLVVQQGRPTRFSERAPDAPAWLATAYLAVLGSHTILAALVAPLALTVTYLGLRDRIGRHVRLARWVLPLWLYVSVTGVVVYVMLYRLYPSP